MYSIRITSILCFGLLLTACGTARLELPPTLMDQAEVIGGPSARMWGDELPNNIVDRVERLRQQFGSPEGYNVFLDPPTYLAISGGGANGAFGAGLLKGWSESGARPELLKSRV